MIDPRPLPFLHSQQLRHGAGPQLLFQDTLDPGQLPVDGAGGFGQVFAVEIRLEAVGEKKFLIRGPDRSIGTPQQLYQRPKNLFTATFIGRTNIVEGTLTVGENGTGSLVLARTCGADITGLKGLGKGTYPVKVSVRPEEFVIHESGKAGAVEAVVESSIFLGLNTHYNVRLATGERVDIIQESTIDHIIKPQTKISLTVKQEKIDQPVYLCDGRFGVLPHGALCAAVSPDLSAPSGAVVSAYVGCIDGWGGGADL